MGAYKSAKLTLRMITFRSGIRFAPPKREVRIYHSELIPSNSYKADWQCMSYIKLLVPS